MILSPYFDPSIGNKEIEKMSQLGNQDPHFVKEDSEIMVSTQISDVKNLITTHIRLCCRRWWNARQMTNVSQF